MSRNVHDVPRFRGIRSWPDVNGEENGPDLEQCAEYHILGV